MQRQIFETYLTGPGSALNRVAKIKPVMVGTFGRITLRQYRNAVKKLGGNSCSLLRLIDGDNFDIVVFRGRDPWFTLTKK